MVTPTEKGYELSFEERPDYLYVLVKADTIDITRAKSYLSEVARKSKELGIKRVLLERDIPVILRDSELFFATNYFLGLMKGKRVAFVNPHNSIDQDMDFAILVAKNRGASHRLCRTIEAAERWLKLR
jgi:hypothetical protein